MLHKVLASWVWVGLSAVIVTGCTYDSAQIEERRCENDAACAVLGEGFICTPSKYCSQLVLKCTEDFDCDDKAFCTGQETCDPGNEAADERGCVAGDAAALLQDDVDCTTDYCDENAKRIIHDPAGCECANDQMCEQLNTDPCRTSSCSASKLCESNASPDGEQCEDGILCTSNTQCNAGTCQFITDTDPLAAVNGPSVYDNAPCSDGLFCNGTEVCDPSNSVDPTSGCIPGSPPTEGPDADDEIECTRPFCFESGNRDGLGQIVQDPSGCECESEEDCRQGTCELYFCSEITKYRCVREPNGGFAPVGAECSDGFECTANDVCDTMGQCVGQPVQALCEVEAGCNSALAVCDISLDTADPATGCVCQ